MLKADSIIYGNIVTLDTDKPLAKAMVTKNGRIVYVGYKNIAEKMKGKDTTILDYGNCYVYPGFMDAHTHGPLAGEQIDLQINLRDQKSMQGYIDALDKFIKKNPNRDYYLGCGWVRYEEPTASMIDKVCKDKPVILQSSDGHSLWVNSKAMEICGVDKNYAKEFGTSEVHIDEKGNPSGLLCEKAIYHVYNHFTPSRKEMKKALLAWQKFAFSQGITAVGEAMLDCRKDYIEAYDELVKEGKWKLRTYAWKLCQNLLDTPEKIGEQLKKDAEKYNSEYFKIAGLKIMLDGVVEARTAAMIDDYADEKGYKGVLNIKDPNKLKKIVLSANKEGFSVHTHAIGDKAAQMILDAYETVETTTCNFDSRNIICHLQCIKEEDIVRCGQYNIYAVVAPTWAPVVQPYFNQTIAYLGEKRTWKNYPIASFEKAGAPICFHTDYPVNRIMDIPLSVYTAVKRAKPHCQENGGPKSVMNPDEAISSYRSLMSLTTNIACMFKQERNLGILNIGKVANATVYSEDFVDYTNVENIMNAKLIATIVDGQEVYHAKNR